MRKGDEFPLVSPDDDTAQMKPLSPANSEYNLLTEDGYNSNPYWKRVFEPEKPELSLRELSFDEMPDDEDPLSHTQAMAAIEDIDLEP